MTELLGVICRVSFTYVYYALKERPFKNPMPGQHCSLIVRGNTIFKWLKNIQYFSKSPISSALWTGHCENLSLPSAWFVGTLSSQVNDGHLFRRESFYLSKGKIENVHQKRSFLHLMKPSFFTSIFFYLQFQSTNLIFTLTVNMFLYFYAAYYRIFSWNYFYSSIIYALLVASILCRLTANSYIVLYICQYACNSKKWTWGPRRFHFIFIGYKYLVTS